VSRVRRTEGFAESFQTECFLNEKEKKRIFSCLSPLLVDSVDRVETTHMLRGYVIL